MTTAERNQRERAFSRELVRKHPGDWVAVRDREVIASATTATDLDEQLAQERLPYRTFRVSRGGGVTLLLSAHT